MTKMREAANTVRDTACPLLMPLAVAEKHDAIAKLARDGVFNDISKVVTWPQHADRLLMTKPKC